MTNRQQAVGMWLLALVFLGAFALNIDLRDSGEAYRPLHILLCIPLAIYSAIVGVMKWLTD